MKKAIIITVLFVLLSISIVFVYLQIKQHQANNNISTESEANKTIKQPSLAISLLNDATEVQQLQKEAEQGKNQYSTPSNLNEILGDELFGQLLFQHEESGYNGSDFAQFFNGD